MTNLIVISLIILAFQFYQSFATSSSLDMVGMRGEDDGAFFPLLIKIHNHMRHGDVATLLKGHIIGERFGYGWLFWILSALFAIPGAIIRSTFGIDNFLISSPSQLCILMTFGGLFFFYKALSYYTKDEFIKFSAILFIFSYPAFGYLSVKWHPTAFNFFFNALVFFQLAKLKEVNKRNLFWIALTLAMSIGSRITGLFMAPLVGLILADRLHWQINKKNLLLAFYFLLLLLVLSIFFYNPSLLVLKKTYYMESYKILSNISGLFKENIRCPQCSLPSFRINKGLFEPFFKLPIFIFMLSLYVYLIATCKAINTHNKRDGLFVMAVLFIVIIYLSLGPKFYVRYSFTPYLFTISFLFPFSLIALSRQVESRKQNHYQSIRTIVVLVLLFANVFS